MSVASTCDAVWIAWETQPRNRSMARELGIPLHEFDFGGSRASRQLRATLGTLRLLRQARPRVVFAPNPSLVLTYLLLALRSVFGFRLISDAHYGGVVAVTGSKTLQRLLDHANARADMVIVTNPGHAELIRHCGGTPFICPDPLPTIPHPMPRPAALNGAGRTVLFICSFDIDEPYPEVFEAARILAGHGIGMYVSGPYTRASLTPAAVRDVTLLGYVDRPTYDAFLRNVDVALDLTTWENCLVCGAYEAMAVGTPCVLSRTPALTNLFTHGVVFSSHDPASIAAAVLTVFERRNELQAQIAEWVVRHHQATRHRMAALRSAARVPARAA